MSPTKPGKTLADYLAIALSPALIMALVGSLVFFTLEFSYRGQYAGSLRWMLFWFVLASVLISRISIEHGSTHAGIYGLGLGAAVALKMFRWVPLYWRSRNLFKMSIRRAGLSTFTGTNCPSVEGAFAELSAGRICEYITIPSTKRSEPRIMN